MFELFEPNHVVEFVEDRRAMWTLIVGIAFGSVAAYSILENNAAAGVFAGAGLVIFISLSAKAYNRAKTTIEDRKSEAIEEQEMAINEKLRSSINAAVVDAYWHTDGTIRLFMSITTPAPGGTVIVPVGERLIAVIEGGLINRRSLYAKTTGPVKIPPVGSDALLLFELDGQGEMKNTQFQYDICVTINGSLKVPQTRGQLVPAKEHRSHAAS